MTIIAGRYRTEEDASALLSPLNVAEFPDSVSNEELAAWFYQLDANLFLAGSLSNDDLGKMVDVARKNQGYSVRIDCGPGNPRYLVIRTA